MTTPRRIVAAGLATTLAWTLGMVTAPAPSANEGRIFVSVLDGTLLLEGVGVSAFGPEEELVISIKRGLADPTQRFLYVEMLGTNPRPILADRNTGYKCGFDEGKQGAEAVCGAFGIGQVRVDFGSLDGATTVAMAEGMTLPLAFNGGSGADYVQGASGDDWIRGNGGNDFLYGGPGNDYLDGGQGDDYLEGEEARDDMRGGAGSNSLEAADGIADVRVDCGGLPKLLDFDEGLDKPTNCGANPTPIPPAPLEPTDPPAPGQGNGTVDGVPTVVNVTSPGGDNRTVTFTASANNIFMNTGLWLGTHNGSQVPIFPPLNQSNTWSFTMPGLFPNSFVDLSIWSVQPTGPTSVASAAGKSPRSQAISTTGIKANAQGVAEGEVPVPAGQKPGDFIVQVNAVTSSGATATLNVGVALTESTPDPDPGPAESITIASATRGIGKKAATITVSGSSTGLAGTGITPRYRVQGAKKWTLGKPVTVAADGSFTWRLVTPKKVRIMLVSGAIKSKAVQVAAVRR